MGRTWWKELLDKNHNKSLGESRTKQNRACTEAQLSWCPVNSLSEYEVSRGQIRPYVWTALCLGLKVTTMQIVLCIGHHKLGTINVPLILAHTGQMICSSIMI